MKATEQTLQQAERAIRKTIEKFPPSEEASLLTDIHLRVSQDTGELTTFDDDDLVRKALGNGAKGYLIKNHTPEHLKQMIKSVYNGTGVMEENILESISKSAATTAGKGFDESGYTERELEIVRAVADGLSNKEIASKLFISEGTVKNYITSILAKEGLSHRTALAVYYITGKK